MFINSLSGLLVVLFASIIAINAREVHTRAHYGDIYRDCGSQTAQIVDLNLTDCTKPPCIFVRGNNYTMDLVFTSKADSTSALNEVYGVIAGVHIPFRLPNNDGCSSGIECPFKNGSINKESLTLPVLSEYPRISLIVEWRVIDDKKNQLVCFRFPVQIS